MKRRIEYADTAAARRLKRLRAESEGIMRLANHLSREDRLLLIQRYEHGLTYADIARLSGATPRTVKRRILTLLRHLHSDAYRFMISRGHILPEEVRRTAAALILERQTLRDVSRNTGHPVHTIREHLQVVRALAKAV